MMGGRDRNARLDGNEHGLLYGLDSPTHMTGVSSRRQASHSVGVFIRHSWPTRSCISPVAGVTRRAATLEQNHEFRVADDFRVAQLATVACALRICCGKKRNAHCVDSDGKRACRCGVAADSGGAVGGPPPRVRACAARKCPRCGRNLLFTRCLATARKSCDFNRSTQHTH